MISHLHVTVRLWRLDPSAGCGGKIAGDAHLQADIISTLHIISLFQSHQKASFLL
jgi:hypothetical protein